MDGLCGRSSNSFHGDIQDTTCVLAHVEDEELVGEYIIMGALYTPECSMDESPVEEFVVTNVLSLVISGKYSCNFSLESDECSEKLFEILESEGGMFIKQLLSPRAPNESLEGMMMELKKQTKT